MRQSGYGNELSSLTGCCCQCCHTTLKRSDTRLEYADGGVPYTTVYVAKFLEAKEIRGMRAIIEGV